MTRIYTCNVPIEADVVDAFCWLQKGFTDQFVYYDKQNPTRYMGLGRWHRAAQFARCGIRVRRGQLAA